MLNWFCSTWCKTPYYYFLPYLFLQFIYHVQLLDNADMIFCSASHEWLHIVSWEESCYSIHHTFPPSIIIFLQNINNGVLIECELILLVGSVIIHSNHCWKMEVLMLPKIYTFTDIEAQSCVRAYHNQVNVNGWGSTVVQNMYNKNEIEYHTWITIYPSVFLK